MPAKGKRKVRVLRVVEYYGYQDAVDAEIAKAVHGKLIVQGKFGSCEITAATVEQPLAISKSIQVIGDIGEDQDIVH